MRIHYVSRQCGTEEVTGRFGHAIFQEWMFIFVWVRESQGLLHPVCRHDSGPWTGLLISDAVQRQDLHINLTQDIKDEMKAFRAQQRGPKLTVS